MKQQHSYSSVAKNIQDSCITLSAGQQVTAQCVMTYYRICSFGSGVGVSTEDDVECRRWLYAIARNACIDYFRSSARFSNFSEKYTKECSTSNGIDEPGDDKEEVWKELSKLSDTDRSILYLHVKEGYAYREIAGMLDLNENQVRVKAFRALKKLRDELVGMKYER